MKIKIIILAILGSLALFVTNAQTYDKNGKDVKVYKAFIYTSETLPKEIQNVSIELGDSTRRSLGSDLLNATLGAAKGIGAGYISSFIDLGVNALGSLITRNARLQNEWEETVKKENNWTERVSSIQDVKDFYKKPSFDGALDPLTMTFDGIGCLRMEGPDTVFFISCHIDRNKLDRIINHSKFELVLDTLIVSPFHSNLPNTQLPLEYSFEERGPFNLMMNIKLTSSWFTDAIEIHNDETLGEFKISIPVKQEDLDKDGYLKYYRNKGEKSKYNVLGESFIVPRSYMAYRDNKNDYQEIWGTGQYKLDIELSETCNITDEYRANWKKDRKKRKKMKPEKGFFQNIWQTVTSQKWDELSKAWVITTLKAPAGVLTTELLEHMGMDDAAAAGSSGNKSSQQQGWDSNIPKNK